MAFCAAVAGYGLLLRESRYAGGMTLAGVLEIATDIGADVKEVTAALRKRGMEASIAPSCARAKVLPTVG